MKFSLAFVMGFSVASIPGPTIVLIATETLRKGSLAGLLTMTAPVLIDAMVMLPLGLLLQISLSGTGAITLALIGAVLLGWMGIQSIQAGAENASAGEQALPAATAGDTEIPSFVKGVLTHLTSPYPYLFWGTAGSSFVRQGFDAAGALGAAIFPLGFWAGACAFTAIAIYLLARGKKLLPPRFEPYLHRLSGALLIGSGLFLLARVWRGMA